MNKLRIRLFLRSLLIIFFLNLNNKNYLKSFKVKTNNFLSPMSNFRNYNPKIFERRHSISSSSSSGEKQHFFKRSNSLENKENIEMEKNFYFKQGSNGNPVSFAFAKSPAKLIKSTKKSSSSSDDRMTATFSNIKGKYQEVIKSPNSKNFNSMSWSFNNRQSSCFLKKKNSDSLGYSKSSKIKRSVTFNNESVATSGHRIDRQLTPYFHKLKQNKREFIANESDDSKSPNKVSGNKLNRALFLNENLSNNYIDVDVGSRLKNICSKNLQKKNDEMDDFTNFIQNLIKVESEKKGQGSAEK